MMIINLSQLLPPPRRITPTGDVDPDAEILARQIGGQPSTARRKSFPSDGPLPASLRARPIHRTTRESETYKGRSNRSPPLEGELEGVKNFCRNALVQHFASF
jgi:hypothetical protein